MKGIAVRHASMADSEQIARLVTELGYPASATQMQRRLQAIRCDESYATLIAYEESEIVGFVGTRIGPLYEHDDPYGQIMALVVAAAYRRRGVGRLLMHAAESHLWERGARIVVVASGNHRADAHTFYERCGYTFTGRRYRKSLLSSG